MFDDVVMYSVNGKQWSDAVSGFGIEEVEKLNVWLDLMEFLVSLEDRTWKSVSQVKSYVKHHSVFIGLVSVLVKWGEFEKIKTEDELEARIEYLSAYCFPKMNKKEK